MENNIYKLGYLYDDVINVVKTSKRIHEAYKYVIKNNNSNELPYHGIRHILNVFRAASHLMKMNKDSWSLSNMEKEALYIAILFHDFNHSGGEFDDSYNIDSALAEFNYFVNHINDNLEPKDKYYQELVEEVINNIKSTQYPYVIPKEDLTLSQKIIRTSDLLQVIYGNVLTDYILPIYDELVVSQDDEMELIEFIDKCIDFWEKIEFSIDFIYCEMVRENTISEFKKYKEILK